MISSPRRLSPVQRVGPVPFKPHPGRQEADEEIQSGRCLSFLSHPERQKEDPPRVSARSRFVCLWSQDTKQQKSQSFTELLFAGPVSLLHHHDRLSIASSKTSLFPSSSSSPLLDTVSVRRVADSSNCGRIDGNNRELVSMCVCVRARETRRGLNRAI